MSEGAAIAITSPRVRAISFASAALVVILICLALIVLSRVVTQLEHAPIAGVQVEIVEREPPRRAPPPRTPPPGALSSNAPPSGTEIPLDRAMLARTLRCFGLRPGQPRPAECPPAAQEHLDAAGGDFRHAPGAIPEPFVQNSAQVAAGIPPPCIPGPTTFCARGGVVPQEASRSAEDVCLAGGIGPCTPPAFRPEDVVRLPHTE